MPESFTFKKNIAYLLILYILGLFLVYSNYDALISNLHAFTFLYLITIIISPPKFAISALSIFYIYYGLWFVLAPHFAQRYQGGLMNLKEYSLAQAFAYTVFGLGVICIKLGEQIGSVSKIILIQKTRKQLLSYKMWIIILYLSSSLFLLLIVTSSGGISVWIADPGDAFLNRAGSGVFVILSHFSSLALACISGYWAYKNNNKIILLAFIMWVILTSPIHGSKFQISLLIIVLFIPWVKDLKIFSFKSYVLGSVLIAIFFLGLYFRNFTWIDAETILPYSLNYFTALENLAISIRDFKPAFLMTFFLPFVKFLTPFGLNDSTMYYDMNHFLTDIYYPSAWEIRATEQWPVETDLYLNFYFFLGLPIIGLYLFLTGWIYGKARRANSLGTWFAAIVMSLFMVSHLRGSLINHTDFYMYPYIYFMYMIFKYTPIVSNKRIDSNI